MENKRELFKELGWDDNLIDHFTINDDFYEGHDEQVTQYNITTFDVHSKIYSFENKENELIYIKK